MKRKSYTILLVAIISLLIIVGLWMWTYFDLKDENNEARGTFGDMFGGLNTLFSGLAFAGIIVTILLQSKELSLQRRELELTRKELERAAEAQQAAQTALSNQVINFKLSSKLTALNTLLNYYNELEIRMKTDHLAQYNRGEIIRVRDKYLKQIEELIDSINLNLA